MSRRKLRSASCRESLHSGGAFLSALFIGTAAKMATAVLAAAAVPSGTSAAGTLALLEEDDDSLKVHALQLLDKSVHDFWFQIASSIASIEALYEDEEFSHRELAALVVSKVGRLDRKVLGEWRAK